MRRATAVVFGLLWLAACTRGSAPGSVETHPNVLILLGDTVRADYMSLYGHDRPTTPRIDAFAKRGRVYERALSAGVWTLPSHVSLFTGLAVSAHGIDRVNDRLPEEETTLAEIFADAGYDTWAFTANPFVSPANGVTQGFAVVETAWGERWRDEVARTMRTRLFDGDVNSKRARLQIATGAQMGFQAAGLEAHRGFVQWLEGRSSQHPFFAFINYMEAHTPRIPSEEARARVMSPELSAHSLTVPQTVEANVGWMAGVHEYSPRDLEALRSVYDAALVDWDAAVGGLLDDLQERGILDHTIVLITADHGESLGEHHRMGHQFNVHSPVAHVPLIIVAPGLVPPGRVEAPTSTTDVFRAVLELAGVGMPRDLGSRQTTGKSDGDAAGVLTEYTAPHHFELAMLRYYKAPNLKEFRRTFAALERGHYRIITASDGTRMLFDERADPLEEKDISDARPGIADEMESLLRTRLGVRSDSPAPGQAAFGEAERARLRALGYVE